MIAALLGLTNDASRMLLERAATQPAPGYRFIGFAPHMQDYEPSADHFANMVSASVLPSRRFIHCSLNRQSPFSYHTHTYAQLTCINNIIMLCFFTLAEHGGAADAHAACGRRFRHGHYSAVPRLAVRMGRFVQAARAHGNHGGGRLPRGQVAELHGDAAVSQAVHGLAQLREQLMVMIVVARAVSNSLREEY